MSRRLFFNFGVSPQTEFVEPDVLLSFSPGSSADAPDHPLESGTAVSDSVIRKPRTATLVLLFVPTSSDPDHANLVPTGPTRPDIAVQRLQRASDEGQLCDVMVDGRFYSPAVLLSVTAVRTKDDGASRQVTVQLKEIITVESQTVQVPKMARHVRHKAKTQSKGVVPANPIADGAAAIRDTIDALINNKG